MYCVFCIYIEAMWSRHTSSKDSTKMLNVFTREWIVLSSATSSYKQLTFSYISAADWAVNISATLLLDTKIHRILCDIRFLLMSCWDRWMMQLYQHFFQSSVKTQEDYSKKKIKFEIWSIWALSIVVLIPSCPSRKSVDRNKVNLITLQYDFNRSWLSNRHV